MITYRLNNILLEETNKTQWVNDEKEEIKNTYLEIDDSENTRQSLQEAAEAILRGKFTATALPPPDKNKKQIKLPYHQKNQKKITT